MFAYRSLTMKKIICTAAILIFLLGASPATAADAYASSPYLFSAEELDELLAPIALYPDPLLAVLLPAATYPGEIEDAQAWLDGGGTQAAIASQRWDESVKAVAYYPEILRMMADSPDWTADVGDAFLNQPEDVAASIQRLRWRARDAGNLSSGSEQQVQIEGDTIAIVPAQADYLYVPEYNPDDVYRKTWVPGMPPVIVFGMGFAIGGWLIMDFDWPQRHVVYHGWKRPGWVNRARPYVRVTNVYVNRSRPFINQTWRHDRAHGDPERFRAARGIRAVAGRPVPAPEMRGKTTAAKPPGTMFGPRGDAQTFSNRGRQSRETIGTQQQQPPGTITRQQPPPSQGMTQRQTPPAPSAVQRWSLPTPQRPGPGQRKTPAPEISPRPGITQRPSPQTPRVPEAVQQRPPAPEPSRRQTPSTERVQRPAPSLSGRQAPAPGVVQRPAAPRESIQPQRAPSGAFGGYRGTGEAATQSLRGRESRQSSPAVRPPAPVSRPSQEVTRPSAPPSRPSQMESKPSAPPSRPETRPAPSGRESRPADKPGRR